MRLVVIGLILIAEAALSVSYVHSKIWPDSRTQAAPAAPSVHIHSAAPASPAPPVGANRGPASVPPRAAASPANVQSSVPPRPTTVAASPGQASVPPSAAAASPGHMHSSVPPSPAMTGTPTGSAPAPGVRVTPAAPASATPAVVAADPCAAQHDSFKVRGPDGLLYATWHPPSVGNCHFGHEHGDDPRGSPALNGRPVIFGYAAAQIQMTEPHAGFKVFRQDNVNDSHAPNHTGASLVMALHQGSSGAKRFTEVHHSLAFHYVNPRDGREVHIEVVAPFGTLVVGCGANDPTMVLRQQQAGIAGVRQVSADKCFDLPQIPYEDWITALYVGTNAQGGWKAYFDPHFAIFNPNTYCIVVAGACTLAQSDARARTGADPLSAQARFKGVKREAYLNQVWLDNSTGSTSVWTDAHGVSVSPGSPGAIQQYIATTSARPLGDSIAFGEGRVYDDGTVRAPN
jgi:hypothetical protein